MAQASLSLSGVVLAVNVSLSKSSSRFYIPLALAVGAFQFRGAFAFLPFIAHLGPPPFGTALAFAFNNLCSLTGGAYFLFLCHPITSFIVYVSKILPLFFPELPAG
jgi:hypothetical protein